MPEIEYAYTNGVVRTNAYRYVGEMIYRTSSNILQTAETFVYDDRILFKQNKKKHGIVFGKHSEYEPYLRINRNILLEQFVKALFISRKARILRRDGENSYFVDLPYDSSANTYFYPERTLSSEQGAVIQFVSISEEKALEDSGLFYTPEQFIDVTVYAVAHEFSHLIGLRHENGGNISLLDKAYPVSLISVTSNELQQVKLKERASVIK